MSAPSCGPSQLACRKQTRFAETLKDSKCGLSDVGHDYRNTLTHTQQLADYAYKLGRIAHAFISSSMYRRTCRLVPTQAQTHLLATANWTREELPASCSLHLGSTREFLQLVELVLF